MNEIKLDFSIGDLENLSGIKAHTIRIWEKRYGILEPARKDSKSRLYTNQELQKVLNIASLIQHGYKISKIAVLSNEEISELVKNLEIDPKNPNVVLQQFKTAMMTYNEELFWNTYKTLKTEIDVSTIFTDYIFILLQQTGFLWQTQEILPSHEHFVSNIIRMILINETCNLNQPQINQKFTYILFTPLGEIHELALLFIQFQLKKLGLNSIYLGTNVPINTLQSVNKQYNNCIYILHNTVLPNIKITDLILQLQLHQPDINIWISGKYDLKADKKHDQKFIKHFDSLVNFHKLLKKNSA